VKTKYEIPDIATEMAKCGRYLRKAKPSSGSLSIDAAAHTRSSTTTLYVSMLFPEGLSKTPVITATNLTMFGGGSSTFLATGTIVNIDMSDPRYLNFEITNFSGLATNRAYGLTVYTGGKLAIDARPA
jgi:hypothetical protein